MLTYKEDIILDDILRCIYVHILFTYLSFYNDSILRNYEELYNHLPQDFIINRNNNNIKAFSRYKHINT